MLMENNFSVLKISTVKHRTFQLPSKFEPYGQRSTLELLVERTALPELLC